MGVPWLRSNVALRHSDKVRFAFIVVGLASFIVALLALLIDVRADVAPNQYTRIEQEALTWTTDYEGLIDGKPGDETAKAIKQFQNKLGHGVTGVLTPAEHEALVKQGYAKRSQYRFEQVTDPVAGVSVGLPKSLLPATPSVKAWGKSWSSTKNGLSIDTLRFGNDVSFRAPYDKLKSANNRTIAYSRFVDDRWFVISAFEKDAAVYVRADLVKFPDKPDEIRGFSIWMSKDRPADYQSIAPAMLSSFRSNTDTSNDTSHDISKDSASSGPYVPPPKPDPGHIDTSLAHTPPVIVPIPVPNRPPPLGTCFFGIGDCPPSAFAFR